MEQNQQCTLISSVKTLQQELKALPEAETIEQQKALEGLNELGKALERLTMTIVSAQLKDDKQE